MKRRLLSVILAICLCLSLLPTAVLADGAGTGDVVQQKTEAADSGGTDKVSPSPSPTPSPSASPDPSPSPNDGISAQKTVAAAAPLAAAANVSTAVVTVTVQYNGGYKTFNNLTVSSDAAESYGYTADIANVVSLLDVLFTVHEQLYGDAFKAAAEPDANGNWSNDYISIGPRGSGRIVLFKMFGETTYDSSTDTYLGDFTLNGVIPNDGWYPCGAAINFKYPNMTAVNSGDIVQFFTNLNTAGKYTWLEYKGAVASWKNAVTVAKGTDVTLTAKQVEFESGLGRSATLSELHNNGEAAKNLKLGYVDLDTGAITPISGAVTAKDGTVTLQFTKGDGDQQVYYITAYSDDKTAVSNLTEVIVVDQMENNNQSVSAVTVSPVSITSATGRFITSGTTNYASCVSVGDQIAFKAYDEKGRQITSSLTWSGGSSSYATIDASTGIMTVVSGSMSSPGGYYAANVKATYKYKDESGNDVSVSGSVKITLMSAISLSDITCAINNSDNSLSAGTMYVAYSGYASAGLASWTVCDPDGAIDYTVTSSSALQYTAVRPGVATVTCSESGNPNNTSTAKITVTGLYVKAPDGYTGNATAYVGEDLQLSTKAAKDATVTWSSGNEAAATVDNAGKVTPVTPGTAVITATDSVGNKGTITVLVKAPDDYSLDRLFLMSPNTATTSSYYLGSALSSGSCLIGARQYYEGAQLKADVPESYNILFALSSSGDAFNKTYYVNDGTTALRMVLAPFFDADRVAAEVWRNGVKYADCTSGGYIALPLNAATTTVTIKTFSKAGGANAYREYTYNIIKRGGSTDDGLGTVTAKVVTDSGRTNYSDVLFNISAAGVLEGGLCSYIKSTGTLYSSSGGGTTFSDEADYYSFVYSDATGVNLTLSATDTITGHVRYSTDNGATWTECPSPVSDIPTLYFGDSDRIPLLIQCVSDAQYLISMDTYGDGWHTVPGTYNYTVCRLSASPDQMRLDDLKFTDNCTEGSPAFNSASLYANALVNDKATAAGIKVKFDDGKYSLKLGKAQNQLSNLADIGAQKDSGGYYDLSVLMGSVNSKTGVYTSSNMVSYYLNVCMAANVADGDREFSLEIRKPYTLVLSRRASSSASVNVVDYVVPNSLYTNSYTVSGNVAGYFPEQTLSYGNVTNSTSCKYISLGSFGGYITYYFADGIENSPNNPYGVDFSISSSSYDNRACGIVYVSEDGEKWYELAGSEHYDTSTTWNYSRTYTPATGAYPDSAFYTLHNFAGEDTSMTFTGTLVKTAASGLAWGYAGTDYGSGFGNPYGVHNHYGDSFDLSWAVDEDGSPVCLDTVHYVKVMSDLNSANNTNNDTYNGGMIRSISAATPGDTPVCQTAVPTSITVGNTVIYPEDGVNVYYAAVDSYAAVKTTVVSSATNVFINNFRGSTYTYPSEKFDSTKGIIRVVVQDGTCEPRIYYIHVVTTTEVTAMIEALPANITLDDAQAVTAAANAYEALSDAQRGNVSADNKKKLEDARNAYSSASIARVKNLIAAIGTVSLSSGDTIAAARRAYDKLTSVQQADVDTYSTLTTAEVSYVVLLIGAIGEVVTKDSGGAISTARKAYDALDSGEQNSVTNYSVLMAAEISYVKALIDAINLAEIYAETAAKITTATSAYDALNAAEKAELQSAGYDEKLASLHNAYAVSQATAFIDVLPAADSSSSVLLAAAESIEDAYNFYDELTADQKTMIQKTSVDSVDRLNAVYSAYQIASVEALIALIHDPVTLTDNDAATAASAAYKKLTKAQKATVDSDTAYALSKATVEIKDIQDYQVRAVTLLNNYPDKSKYSGSNADDLVKALAGGVTAINAACDKGTVSTALDAAKAAVDAVPTDSELADDANAAAAASVTAQIEAIQSTAYKDLKLTTEAARKAYDTLTGAQKALITADTLKILTDAENLLNGSSGSSGYPSGGGSSSGNNSGSGTTPATTVSGDTEKVTATASGSTDSNGTTDATVTADTLDNLVKAAKDAESSGKAVIVEIKIGSTAETKSAKLTIPGAAFEKISDGTKSSVMVDAGVAAVTFSKEAVAGISTAAGTNDISIAVNAVDASTLPAEIRQVVGSRPVFDFSVTAGGNQISTFGSGSASVSIPYTLKAGEDAAAVVVYYIDNSGNLQTVRGAYNDSTKSVDFIAAHFSRYAVGYNALSFTDARSGAWYSSAVTFCAARGITTGTTDTVFSPGKAVTRGQFIVMLLRAYGIEPDSNPADNFADAGNTYYTNYLAKAKALGISEGKGNNLFAPDEEISRQEMFTMLYRALSQLNEVPAATVNKALTDFKDAGLVSNYARDAATALIRGGVVTGNGGVLDPNGQATRAQVVLIFYSLLSK